MHYVQEYYIEMTTDEIIQQKVEPKKWAIMLYIQKAV